MARFRFLDEIHQDEKFPQGSENESVTTNQLPEKSLSKEKKSRFRFLDEQLPSKKSKEEKIGGLSDFVKGAAKGGIEQFLGSYGDIFDLFGLGNEGVTPGEEAKYRSESEALKDLENSPSKIALLQDEDILPRYSGFPTSKEVGNFLEEKNIFKSPQTTTGKFGQRIGQLAGGAASLGTPQITQAIAAGTVGQAAEELGAPKWLQAALEIGTYLKTSKTPKKGISSTSKEVQQEIDKLKKLGYSEEDITLAKNALEDRGWLKKVSKITQKSEDKFKQSIKNSENHVSEILETAFPGMKEQGSAGIRNVAEELFESLDDIAKNVIVENPESFVKNADKAIQRMKSTLANTPQEKEIISILESAKDAAVEGRSADVYTRFYRGLNQIGKWGNPKEREYVFSTVKDAIKQTFKDQGLEGKKLASALEESNKAWIKYLNAQDMTDLIAKVTTEEGINFSKFGKLLDNPSNYKSIEKAVGREPAKNLKTIANTASSIKDLKKVIEGGEFKHILGTAKMYAIGKGLLTGDFRALGFYIGSQAAGKLATKFLTDPKYQNLQKKALSELRIGNLNAIRNISQSIDKELPSKK